MSQHLPVAGASRTPLLDAIEAKHRDKIAALGDYPGCLTVFAIDQERDAEVRYRFGELEIELAEEREKRTNTFDNLTAECARIAKLYEDARARLSDEDAGCICKGNWRAIVKQVEPLIGKQFLEERNGKVWRFFGVVHGDDDYYYGMSRPGELCLASCVGSLEGNGFTLADEAPK